MITTNNSGAVSNYTQKKHTKIEELIKKKNSNIKPLYENTK